MREPFGLAAIATRFLGFVEASVYAVLPDGCHEARITDIYPGGQVVYIVDPGAAQLFVEFTRRDGPCEDIIRPWRDSREIPDSYHSKLEVVATFEGREFRIETPIYDFKLTRGPGIDPGFNPKSAVEDFIVIALVEPPSDLHLGCRIVPRDAVYPAIFRQVFGPATLDRCREWIGHHCASV